MKVVMATPCLYDSTSPFNHLLFDILNGLISDGASLFRIVATEDKRDRSYTMGIEGDAVTYCPVKRKSAPHASIIKRYLLDSLCALRMARRIRKSGGTVLLEDVSYSSLFTVRAAKRRGMRVVAMLQDIWPDNAVASGLIRKGSFLYRFFERRQSYVYKKADKILCISDDMKRLLLSKGIEESRIEVIYNWGYSDAPVDIPFEENAFAEKAGLYKDTFYAVYAGNIGRMQNVELVVAAAELLKNNPGVEFLIIGDGARRGEIEAMVKAAKLPNVRMLPLQPSSLATSLYCAAGVNLIPLVKDGIQTAMPSKTPVVLSCGRPTVFAFGRDCGFAETVAGREGLFAVSCEDARELADTITEIYRERPSARGAHELFSLLFSQKENVRRYVAALRGDEA